MADNSEPVLSEREKRLRTKIDVLWDDVLDAAADNARDIRDLTIRVEQLRAEIPAFIDSVGDKLNTQGGHYLAAAEKLAAVLQAMGQEIDRKAAQAVATATETAKLDIRQAAIAAAGEAVRVAVGDEVAKVVNQVNNAAENLVTQTGAARNAIKDAARSVSWGAGRILGMVVAGGCIGGLVVVLGAPYLQGRGLAPAPDEETAKRIEAGRDFIQVLPQLDNATRDKVVRLIQKNRAEQK